MNIEAGTTASDSHGQSNATARRPRGGSSTRVGVVARFPVAPGCRDKVLVAFHRYLEECRAEGVGVAEIFAVNTDGEDPNVVWFYEVYSDAEEFEAHFHTRARRALHGRLDGLRGGGAKVVRVEPMTLTVPATWEKSDQIAFRQAERGVEGDHVSENTPTKRIH